MSENQSHTKENFMKEAVKLSEYAIENNYGGPFGAVIVKNGKIIGQGCNQVLKTNDPTAHAEITAIRTASKKLKSFDLSGCEIYTSCEPCPMCFSACYWANLDKIYYCNTRKQAKEIGFKDDFIYKEIVALLESKNTDSEAFSSDKTISDIKQQQSFQRLHKKGDDHHQNIKLEKIDYPKAKEVFDKWMLKQDKIIY